MDTNLITTHSDILGVKLNKTWMIFFFKVSIYTSGQNILTIEPKTQWEEQGKYEAQVSA